MAHESGLSYLKDMKLEIQGKLDRIQFIIYT